MEGDTSSNSANAANSAKTALKSTQPRLRGPRGGDYFSRGFACARTLLNNNIAVRSRIHQVTFVLRTPYKESQHCLP